MRKVILINLISVIVILLLGEIIVRSLKIVSLQGYEKNFFYKDKGITLNKPNVLAKVAGKQVKTDENGFRIPIKKYNLNQNYSTTLILGDSVSFGFGVEEKNSFIGISRDKKEKNLYNSSVIGHNLVSYLYILEKYKGDYNKKFQDVVIFLCLNDIHLSEGVVTAKDLKKKQKKPKEGIFISILKNELFLKVNFYLRDKSALFNLMKGLGTNTTKRYYESMLWRYKNEDSLIKYEDYIKNIKKFSIENNLSIKFVLLPYTYQIEKKCEKEFLKPQIKIQKIFKENDIQLYDFTNDFCFHEKGASLFLGFDPVHLSNDGHRLVYELINKNNIL